MAFANPWALLLLLPAGLIVVLVWRAELTARERRRALAPASTLKRQNAEPEPWRGMARVGVYGGACLLIALALSRPQMGIDRSQVSGHGADVLVILDLSNSMRARDVAPSRFAHAVYVAAAILDRVSPLDRVGLAAFSDEGQLECPVTTDLDVLAGRLMQLEPGSIGEGSSDLSQAVRLAAEQFPSPDEPGLALILSDGEDLLGKMDEAALGALAGSGAVVVSVGIGTLDGGRVPAAGPLGRVFGDMVWDNRPVTSRLEEAALRQIAEASGGEYIRMGSTEAGSVAARALGRSRAVARPAAIGALRPVAAPREIYQVPLGIAVLLLLADLCLGALPADWSPRLGRWIRRRSP